MRNYGFKFWKAFVSRGEIDTEFYFKNRKVGKTYIPREKFVNSYEG